MIQKVKNLVLSKGKNIPCVWEEKKDENTVILVCDMKGFRKKPLFMQKESQQQALIPVRTKDVIVKAEKKNDVIEYTIFGIKSIDTETQETELIVLNSTKEGKFEKPLLEKFEAVLEAAKTKVTTDNTLAYYVKKDFKRKKPVEKK